MARTGQPVARIVADFDRDRWFTAQQAVDYGLVDAVLPQRRRPASSAAT